METTVLGCEVNGEDCTHAQPPQLILFPDVAAALPDGSGTPVVHIGAGPTFFFKLLNGIIFKV